MEKEPELQFIIKKPLAELMIWVRDNLDHSQIRNQWWSGLAIVAKQNALPFPDTEETVCLEWAEIAIRVYNHMLEMGEDDSYLNSIMSIRVAMINEGILVYSGVNNLDALIKWFLGRLPVSFDDAVYYSNMPLHLLAEKGNKMLELRRVKNRLGILWYLKDPYRLQLGNEINQWMYISSRLP